MPMEISKDSGKRSGELQSSDVCFKAEMNAYFEMSIA